jgi:hypothetical protein
MGVSCPDGTFSLEETVTFPGERTSTIRLEDRHLERLGGSCPQARFQRE